MATQKGSELVTRIRYLIQDTAGTRWTDAEMLAWLNDGLLELVTIKPTANSVRQTLELVPGPLQSLPPETIQLLRITHNLPSGKACKLVDEDRLDAIAPAWRVKAGVRDADHYVYDPTLPTEYQVYPPNDGNGELSGVVAKPFTAVTSLQQNLPCADHYLTMLVDYALYRVYSKHSKHPGNAERAQLAYNTFVQMLGGKVQRYAALDPHVTNKSANGVE